MKYGIYSIRDSRTGFLPPTVDQNDMSARRNMEHAASQRNSLFFSHPEDYSLFRIGEFDTESGQLTPCVPEFIFQPVKEE